MSSDTFTYQIGNDLSTVGQLASCTDLYSVITDEATNAMLARSLPSPVACLRNFVFTAAPRRFACCCARRLPPLRRMVRLRPWAQLLIMSFYGQGIGPGGSRVPNVFENENGRAPMTNPPQPQLLPPVDLQRQIHLQWQQLQIQQQQLNLQQQLIQERENTLQLMEQRIRAGARAGPAPRGSLPRAPLADLSFSGNKRKRGSKKTENKDAHAGMVKSVAISFLKDGGAHDSVYGFCKAKDCVDLRRSVERFFDHPALSEMKCAANRRQQKMVDSAILAVTRAPSNASGTTDGAIDAPNDAAIDAAVRSYNQLHY